MTTEPAASLGPPRRPWLLWPLVIVLGAAVSLGVRWLLAASEGEKCGGATGCESGLVCVEVGIELVSNVVENRRCRAICTTDAECAGGRSCVQIGNSAVRACLGDADLR